MSSLRQFRSRGLGRNGRTGVKETRLIDLGVHCQPDLFLFVPTVVGASYQSAEGRGAHALAEGWGVGPRPHTPSAWGQLCWVVIPPNRLTFWSLLCLRNVPVELGKF